MRGRERNTKQQHDKKWKTCEKEVMKLIQKLQYSNRWNMINMLRNINKTRYETYLDCQDGEQKLVMTSFPPPLPSWEAMIQSRSLSHCHHHTSAKKNMTKEQCNAYSTFQFHAIKVSQSLILKFLPSQLSSILPSFTLLWYIWVTYIHCQHYRWFLKGTVHF